MGDRLHAHFLLLVLHSHLSLDNCQAPTYNLIKF